MNPFELLAFDGNEDAAPIRKEKKPKEVSTTLTPAERAKQRPQKKRNPAARPSGPDADGFVSQERGGQRRGRGGRVQENRKTHGHVAPYKGRANDRQSAAKTTRNPRPKKGGHGRGNWGKQKETGVEAPEPTETTSNVTEVARDAPVEEGEAAPVAENVEAVEEVEEEDDSTIEIDDYFKQREQQAAALAEKIGAPVPTTFQPVVTSVKPKQPSGPQSRKGVKAVNVADFFNVKIAEPGRGDGGRGRGRGRGRGGRGAARGASRGAERSGSRGNSSGRGGRGGRGGRKLDPTNNRQFPTLG